MAECAVASVLDSLKVVLEVRANLMKDVKEEIEFVRDELERMIAFLRVADAAEDTDLDIKSWVKQVRDVAYDIEDIIAEFMIKLHDSSSNKLINAVGNMKNNYKINSGIGKIKSRVAEISASRRKFDRRPSIGNQGLNLSIHGDDGIGHCDIDCYDEAQLVGIEHPKEEIMKRVVEGDSKLKVVAVVGMGGLGKTTLVKNVFDDAVVKKHFQNHAWITVSQSFKVEELLKATIRQLFDQMKLTVPQEMITMNNIELKMIIKKFLRDKRYVLVFDDVWSIEAWEVIKYALPNDNQGSRVILTTRRMDLASSCANETDGFVYKLNPLLENDSWTLFCQRAFEGSSCPEHLTDTSKNILRKCGGLPLAIVAIGGVLSIKKNNNVDNRNIFDYGLDSELEGIDQLERVRHILLLSFNYLPYYLKPCFLYLSIYPEDQLIGHNSLIRRWISEGFVKQNAGRTVEEVARGYLNELVNRSLLCPVKTNDDGSVKVFRIHDLYREIILSKSRDQNFVTTTAESNVLWPKRVRRLSVHKTLKNEEVERSGVRLCSLLSFNVVDIQSILSITQLLKSSKMMKVLDLTDLPLEKFPEVILELLHLRYLCLRNTRIKELPGSIKKLQKLEMLDLKGTHIRKLPDGILKLQYLRQLLVYCYVPSSYMPYDYIHGCQALKGIGCLKSLQKLSLVEASPESRILEEIATMIELKRVSISKLRANDCVLLCSAIENLRKLGSLALRALEGDVLNLQYLSSPPPYLQRLYLGGRLANFPHWIQSLRSLVKIYLRWSRLSEDPLQYLQDLPILVHVELLDAYIGENLCFKAGKFQKLKLLDFDRLEALKMVTIEEGATPLLEKLIIQRCNLLESVPVGIEHLNNLKVVEFFDMPQEFILPLSGDENWKIEHIPEVNHTYWRNGFWEVYPLDGSLANEESGKPGTPSVTTQEQRNWL